MRSLEDNRAIGRGLLLVALAFHAIALASEIRIGRLGPNDLVFHLAASERLGEALAGGEPFLDPWVSEWALGYPVWRSYQPLPHLVGAAVVRLADPFASPAAAFAAFYYLLLVLFPASVYAGARWLGLSPLSAGLASLLVLAPSEAGDLGRYGLGYGAFVWRGSGLYTQLVALHALVLGLGLTRRALDTGRGRAAAAALLAATALSHVIFGYVGFVSALLLALVGPADERSRRVARLAAIALPALTLLAWFLVPLFLSLDYVNTSRWEDAAKWSSYGAPFLLGEIVAGRFFDAGRLPILSGLVALGALAAVFSLRHALARRLVGLTLLWLCLLFGRETWGHLLLLFGLPKHFHLHRLEGAFELAAVLVGAWGIGQALSWVSRRNRGLGVVFALGLVAAIAAIGVDRVEYLRRNTEWGTRTLAALETDRPDLEAALAEVRAILSERPGRVSAGLAGRWGRNFRVGDVPVYAFLTRAHLDQASFLYHSMSVPSDVMVLRDESDPAHAVAFGIRAVVAPATRRMPGHLWPRGTFGRFAVYEASPEGYFGLVDIGAAYTGPVATIHEPSSRWLGSPLLRAGVVAVLEGDFGGVPAFGRWEPFPDPPAEILTARGRILSETKEGETYRARLLLDRACHAFVKIGYQPDLLAWVDGEPADVLHVTPGFVAVPVPAGEHEVVVRYQPGPLKPVLFLAGLGAFALFFLAQRRPAFARAEAAVANRLDAVGRPFVTPRSQAAIALAILAALALRPLFNGRLVDGHDALEYPPRLVEMARVVSDGHVPPVWAPDLGNGYGQPLFAFAPPLLYAAALPLRAAGLGLSDSLQLALALLFLGGAVAVYRIGRRVLRAPRPAALCGSAAWLFAPYVALNLYVRAAFAEAAAVGLAPVALLAMLRAAQDPSAKRLLGGAVAVALLPLAHNGAAVLLLPALAFCAAAAALTSRRPAASLGAAATTMAGGLGLSAFFWLPALVEKSYVKTDLLREGFLRWSEHALSPWQLLWSPWGYGLSGAGTDDGMSFVLGPVHVLLAGAGVALALRSAGGTRRAIVVASALAALGGAWLATSGSGFVWERIETLQYLAYPWRALMLPALFLPIPAVFAFERLGPRGSAVAVAVLLFLNVSHTEPKGYLTFDDEYYAPASIARKGINTTTREEYEPRWVAARPPYRAEPIVGLDAPLRVETVSSKTHRRELRVETATATRVEVSTFYYPGWTVLVDGSEVAIEPAPGRGTILLELPKGAHTLRIELVRTRVRQLSLLASLTTFGILALCGALSRRSLERAGPLLESRHSPSARSSSPK